MSDITCAAHALSVAGSSRVSPFPSPEVPRAALTLSYAQDVRTSLNEQDVVFQLQRDSLPDSLERLYSTQHASMNGRSHGGALHTMPAPADGSSSSPATAVASSVGESEPCAPQHRIQYSVLFRENITPDLLSECATLFSSHYGVWSRRDEYRVLLEAQRLVPGGRVKMAAATLRKLMLFDHDCGVAIARDEAGVLVGHAFFASFDMPVAESVALDTASSSVASFRRQMRWVTQLVVAPAYRCRGIATALITNCLFQRKHLLAVGLASSHPAAVRALEQAAGTRCSPSRTAQLAPHLFASMTVPYLRGKNLADGNSCCVDTAFFVDHAGVLPLVESEIANGASQPDRVWRLGHLPEGQEFLAIAFIKAPSP